MLKDIIAGIFANFGLSMFVVAIVFMLIHRLMDRNEAPSEILYRWFSFFPLGITSIYAFIMHAFFPEFTARTIGWQTSPFQYEVAMACLAIGVIAILSFKASYGFRLATVIAATCWLWGDAIGHIYQIRIHHDIAPGNAGSWLYMDMVLPVILIIAIVKLKNSQAKRR